MMEERLNYPFDLPVENENVKKAFDVFDSEGGFRYSGLPQELEHFLGVWVFRKAGDGVQGGLRLVRTTLGKTLGKIWRVLRVKGWQAVPFPESAEDMYRTEV